MRKKRNNLTPPLGIVSDPHGRELSFRNRNGFWRITTYDDAGNRVTYRDSNGIFKNYPPVETQAESMMANARLKVALAPEAPEGALKVVKRHWEGFSRLAIKLLWLLVIVFYVVSVLGFFRLGQSVPRDSGEAQPASPPLAYSPLAMAGDPGKAAGFLIGDSGVDKAKSFIAFVDPNCEYCRDQEKEFSVLEKMGYSIKVIPVDVANAESSSVVSGILCSADPRKALADYHQMISAPAACQQGSKALENNRALYHSFGFNSVPVLLSVSSGNFHQGLVSADDAVKLLAAPN